MSTRTTKPLSERERALTNLRELTDPASVEYAWQTVHHLKTMFQIKEASVQSWDDAVADAERNRIFERIPPEKPYGSIDALLQVEIGTTVAEAHERMSQRAQEATPAREHRRPTSKEQANKGNGVTFIDQRGNSADYRTAVIARDAPDVLERMKQGEFATVAAAERAAGLGREDRRVWVPADPARAS